jgi:protein-disulfide isomerase
LTQNRDVPPKNAASRKGNRRFGALILGILVVGVGVIGYIMYQPAAKPIVLDPSAPLPKAEGHVMGSDSAKVEIVEYGDFECPRCGEFSTITEPDIRHRIVDAGLARFRYIDFPLSGHPNTMFAHLAASCAGAQGKFWEMHDRIYMGQPEWTGLGVAKIPNATRIMKLYAKGLALDTKAFDACMDSRQFLPQIKANYEQGVALHVEGTPTFLINNQMLQAGSVPYDMFKKIVDSLNAAPKRTPPAKGTGL